MEDEVKRGPSEANEPTIESLIDVEVRGLSPLLQHRFSSRDSIVNGNAVARPIGFTDYSLEYEDYLYKNEEGMNCEPGARF